MAQNAPLEVSHLIKDYGRLRAVNDVSFALQEGEVFGLLGPNGAGKTSIISTIVTLETPTQGTVRVFGSDVQKQARVAKSKVGFVPQEIINHGYFSVIEILRFHSGYFGLLKNEEQIEFLLKRLKLWEHRHKKVKQLSGGMKRRLLIAKALVHKPRLLLLDEPTAGVDIELRKSLWDFVRELRSDGITVLLTTHYLEEAESLCDRVGILRQGELMRIGPTTELVQQFTQRQVVLQLKNGARDFNHAGFVGRTENVYRFQIPARQAVGELLSELALQVSEILDLRISEGNLEEAFSRVLGDRK